MLEKRMYKRVSAKCILLYRIQEDPQKQTSELIQVETPISLDISEGGVRFLSIQELPGDTILRVVLSLPGSLEAINLKGRVVWCVSDENSRNFQTGMEYTDIRDRDRDAIRQYVSGMENPPE